LAAQVRLAIRLTTGRTPADDEIKADVAFVGKLRESNRLDESQALRIVCLLRLNANEFFYLD
jgi:hypothetical protein